MPRGTFTRFWQHQADLPCIGTVMGLHLISSIVRDAVRCQWADYMIWTTSPLYRHELETRLSHNPWKQEIAKIPDWPRRKTVAEFRLCVGHDCLGTHLHRIGIRPDPYCMLCSLREPMDRHHLGQCTTLLNRTECERYWEARTKMMENCLFTITIFVTTSYH